MNISAKTVSQKDVAKLAGVPRSAVSMYINEYPGLSISSQDRIRAAIKKLDYRPSRIAKSLKENRSLLIGIVYFASPSGTIHDFVLLDLIQGVQKAALEENYVVCFFLKENMSMEETLTNVLKCNVEGIVFIEDNFDHEQIRNLDIPKVVINRKVEGIPSVFSDMSEGTYLTTRYLLSLNHRKIGFIGGKFAEETFQQRWTGYEKALVEAGIKADERFIRHEIMDNKESYLAAMDFFRNKEIPSAIVCDNDLKAWGVMDAVKDSGLTVPEDVSVIGFDNITACTHMAPPLTTVEHPRKEIGYQGGKLLLKIIKEKIKGKNLEVPIRLIKRKSCKKI